MDRTSLLATWVLLFVVSLIVCFAWSVVAHPHWEKEWDLSRAALPARIAERRLRRRARARARVR
jgi:hypothetical protein